MAVTLNDKLVIAISSRALFDFEEENRLFDAANPQPYMQLQQERLKVPAKRGVAFSLVRKLLHFNSDSVRRVEVVVLSRNDPVSALRIFHSAASAGLELERGVFTQGRDPFRYLRPLGAHLFLSANEQDVSEALQLGFPAARVLTESVAAGINYPDELRIAFDGDAVLFSDEAERVYQAEGLAAFQTHEMTKAALPLSGGPFKPLLAALYQLQQQADVSGMRIRTALVTARSAPAHERAINTLMNWGLAVDEAMFLGGLEKGPFLREFEPDFFFDDQTGHVDAAALHVPSGHVSSGISNAAGPLGHRGDDTAG
ncbi:MAG: 5'-nucleotidase [Comamonadaceae bacterium]|nr:MAG: 5'-nucleotidase [Comamonadaceae bacterium]